jgi:4-hydroxy-2-oxoheptanedioate aldolase
MAYRNPFLARLEAGEATIGSWVSTPDPVVAEIIASAGFDHVVADMQHGSIELGNLVPVLGAITAGGSVPIVRVPWNDPVVIGKTLDLGALGVIVPMVETADEAARAVAACRYPPGGSRSSGPLRPNLVMRSDEPSDWERVACVVMVETATGLRNVDAIAATPGLSGLYVGPGDLAISLGLSPYRSRRSPDDETIHATAVEAIRAASDRHGIAAGIYVGEGVAARRYLDAGFRIVTASIDYSLVEEGSRRDLAAARGVSSGT